MYAKDTTFYLNKTDFHLQDYSYVIKKRSQKLFLESKFEILGSFNLPPKTLKVSYSFSNQLSEGNYLSYDHGDKCSNQTQWQLNCYVFKNTSFISTSLDATLSKDIYSPIDIYFDTRFHIDSNNLSVINESSLNNNFFGFIEQVDKTKHTNSFKYKNAYLVKRDEGGSYQQKVDLLSDIFISKGQESKYKHDSMQVDFIDYSKKPNSHIKDWVKISLFEDWNAEDTRASIDLMVNNRPHLIPINRNLTLNNTTYKTSKIFKSLSSISKHWNDEVWAENASSTTGLFIAKPSTGYLSVATHLFHGNKVEKIKLSNFFQFKNTLDLGNSPIASIYKKNYYSWSRQYTLKSIDF